MLSLRGEKAVRLSSWDPKDEVSFFYARPEELTKAGIAKLQMLWQKNLLLAFVVDEAHCSLNWGDNFRVSYSELRRKFAIFPRVPKMALTATASPATVKQIASYLGLRPDYKAVILQGGSPNIFLSVLERDETSHCLESVRRAAKERKKHPKDGRVHARSQWLRRPNFPATKPRSPTCHWRTSAAANLSPNSTAPRTLPALPRLVVTFVKRWKSESGLCEQRERNKTSLQTR